MSTVIAETASPYVARFGQAKPALPGFALPWLSDLRDQAIWQFAESGFPDHRVEAWKYTDLRRLTRQEFAYPKAADSKNAKQAPAAAIDAPRHLLVFVDGRPAPKLCDIGKLPAGAHIHVLSQILADDPDRIAPHLGRQVVSRDTPLAALNAAFMEDGLVLLLDVGTKIEDPVQVLYLTTGAGNGAVTHPHNLIVAGSDSRATLIESYAGPDGDGYWINSVTEITAEAGADINHYKIQQEGQNAFHTGLCAADLASDAAYRSFVMSSGAALSRSETRVRLGAKGADCTLNGACLLSGRMHCDNTTDVEHAATDCTSHQHYKSVVDGRGRSVFQGRVLVQPGAQRTDAHQLNRNLLLAKTTRADTKPELVIHADDVKCSHGATTGEPVSTPQ